MKHWTIVILVLVIGLGVNAAQAQNRNNSKGEVMAQKWEYRILYRNRSLDKQSQYANKATEWEYLEEGKSIGKLDINAKLRELGDNGWELVGISALSANPMIPGFSTEETWVFKRAK